MKATLVLFAATIACSHGFTIPSSTSPQRTSTALNGGFLDGGKKKTDIMQREDDAMWVDDGDSSSGGGWNPFAAKPKAAPKAAAPKAVIEKAPASIKKPMSMPWQKKPAPKPVVEPTPEPPKPAGFKFPWDK
mmetsp:Transcript_21788/g.32060  ORF Transcript_21788/g.32060 Transcript_21788/m.32060 type:complete len:132 (+) Transcript_21788:198-593(+)